MDAAYKVNISVLSGEVANAIKDIFRAAESCGLQAGLLKKKFYAVTVRSTRGIDTRIRVEKARLTFEISGKQPIANAFAAGLARPP